MRVLIPLGATIVLLVVAAVPQFQHASQGWKIAVVAVIVGVFLAVEVAAGRRARRARAGRAAATYPYARR